MKRFALLLVVALVVASCASPSTPPAPSSQDLVSRAVQALGGADKLASVKTISLKGTMRQWEPEQSTVASGPLRFACESTFEMVADTGARAARTDWVRKFAYPAPRTFTYSEIVTTEAGYVAGIDSNGRTKQSLDSTPPAHSMSSLRLATTQRELQRASPLLFLDLQRNAGRLPPMSLVSVGGVTYPAVDYRLGNQTFTVMFDSGTGLPARIRTLDYDNIWGDVTYDLVLSDWQTFDGVRMATTQKYELLGWPVAEVKITEARVNAPVAAERLAIPVAFSTGAPRAATGTVPYQWVIRRQFIGT
jgi:hypothetical protein